MGIDEPYDFVVSTTVLKQVQRVELGGVPHEDAVLLFGDYDNDGYDDLTVTLMQGDNPKAMLF